MSHPISNLRFLELSLYSEDVLHDLNFFQELGFQSIQTNDIWDYPYAVISDGRQYIGIHQKENFEQISPITRFSFAHENIEETHRQIHDNNQTLIFSDLDSDDKIQHTLFRAPSGLGTHILAARPFSPLSNPKESALGYFRAYLIPHTKLNDSYVFWEQLGLLVTEDKMHGIHISNKDFNAILGEFSDLEQPALLFEHPEPNSIFPTLARHGISVNMPESGLPMNGVFSIKTPLGVELIVRQES